MMKSILLYRRVLRNAGWLLLGSALAACSPRFDWRDYRDPAGDSGFVATFPGRVSNAAQPIDLAGQALTMNMWAARVDALTFAVATADLPSAEVAAREQARTALLDALIRNVDGKVEQRERVQVARGAAGKPPLAGEAVEVAGSNNGVAVHLSARVVADGQRLVQIVVLGPQKELASSAGREAVDTFMTSLRLD